MTTAVEVAEKGHQLAAWVNFDGTLAMSVGSSYGPDAPPADYSSPNPIRAAYNVSSITDNGLSNYSVTFTTPMPDAYYSAVVSTSASTAGLTKGSGIANIMSYNAYSMATSGFAFNIETRVGGNHGDTITNCVSVFR